MPSHSTELGMGDQGPRGGLLEAPVTEHALLPVRPGEEAAFERALIEAVPLVASIPGFRGIQVSRGVEQPGTYLLLIGWDSVAAHEIGFRGSPQYARWRDLLHGFYEPFPVVEHFTPVATSTALERPAVRPE